MSAINDGGSAFPATSPVRYDGMSLRDWFAGMALSSMDYGWFGSSTRIQEMASESYQIADAMLVARERKEDA